MNTTDTGSKYSTQSPAPASILLIYTGGTIGMAENPETGALEAINFEYIERHLPEIKLLEQKVDTISFDPVIDSSDMGPDGWIRIANCIKDNYESYDGFVVLHGTDTMAYTASALSYMLLNLTKPVILTGSQLPIGVIRTDGKENLLSTIEIASAKDSQGISIVQEVAIFFNNQLLRGNRTTKISSDQFDAFKSPNYRPLATAGIDIEYHNSVLLRRYSATSSSESLEVCTELDSNVMVLTIFPGMALSVVRSALETPNLRAVVMLTYGSGNAPLSSTFLKLIKEAVERGIIILNVTQCMIGSVNMDRYATGRTLKKAGVISGHDLTVESALTKLMYLLGNKTSNVEEIKELIQKDIRGEISK